jgi:hypothetical protein
MESLSDVSAHLQRFSWADYIVFSGMLLLCIFIGIYFGFVEKRTTDAETNYLMGGRNMMVSLLVKQIFWKNVIIKILKFSGASNCTVFNSKVC